MNPINEEFDRVYFDTNLLSGAGWPHASADLERLLRFAKELDVELYLPDLVEIELEKCWLEQFDKGVTSFKRHVSRYLESPPNINRQQSLEIYKDRVIEIKNLWSVRSLQLTSGDREKFCDELQDFAELLASAVHPKNENDVGFRDSLIFISITSHVQAFPPRHKAALFSADAKFYSHERVKQFCEEHRKAKAKVVWYDTIEKAANNLESRLKDAKRKPIEEKKKQIEKVLRANFGKLAKFVSDGLRPREADLGIWEGQITRLAVSVRSPRNIRVNLPDPLEKKVDFSFDVDVDFAAVLDTSNPLYVKALLQPAFRRTLETKPVPNEVKFLLTGEVEASARVADGKYEDIEFVSVRLKEFKRVA